MPATLNTLSFFVNRTQRIYSLPAVALEVLELTNEPRVDCRALKECIERDPALVSRILRVVNSSLFGLGSEVSDLNQAVALLGIKSLKLLVLGFSLSEAIFCGETCEALQHAWRHALTRALAARELCETEWRVSGDEAFIAGLLAELGKFVLLEELGEPYANLLGAATKDHEDLSRLEQASLGFDHSSLSAELLSHWNLPESLTSAVRLSALPEQLTMLGQPDVLLPAAVRMAGQVADLVVDQRHDCLHELVYNPYDAAARKGSELDRLRLTDDGLAKLVTRVQERIGSLADALSFELPAGQDYRDVLVAAHERLAQLSADAACAVARQWPIVENQAAEVSGLSTAVARYVNRFAETPVPHVSPRTVAAPKPKVASPLPTEPIVQKEANARSHQDPADARILGRLTTVVNLCRQARCSLSLILMELDRPRTSPGRRSADTNEQLRRLQTSAAAVDHPGAVCLTLSETKLALVIADCDRRSAVAIGRQLLVGSQRSSGVDPAPVGSQTLSLGVATLAQASKNFPPGDLLSAAARCLDAAQLSGGNTLKSIDVY